MVGCCPMLARKFGAGDLIWQLDKLVAARVVCDSLSFLVPAKHAGLLGCIQKRVAQELMGMPGEGVGEL